MNHSTDDIVANPTTTGTNNLLVISAIVTLSLAYLTRLAWQWHRLSHIPGPFFASISNLWLIYHTLKRQLPQAFKKATDKYGPLVRVSPNSLVTSDPEIVRTTTAVRSPYTRGPWYDAMKFEPGRDNLFSMRDETRHTKLRAKMAPGYSGKENEGMEACVDEQIARFVHLIERDYVSNADVYRPMDFAEKTQFFTLDVISALAFGGPFGYLTEDKDLFDYIKITTAYIPFMMVLGSVPWVTRVLHSKLLRGLLPSESDKLGFGAFIGVARKVVAERFKPTAQPQFDMLGSFIRHGLSPEECSSEALLQIVAGSDTSASTIRAVILNLTTNAAAYHKLQAEIDAGIASGAISSPIKDSEARRLPYLQAVIKEGLRIMPPATGASFKLVPEQGDVLNGHFIPSGTQIGSSYLSIQHSTSIFGPDAAIFRPERWLDADPTRLANMTNTVDLVFHYGKYQCLGRNVALMEFNKLFIELLRRFDFSIVKPEAAAKVESIGIWLIEDFYVRITERKERGGL
ncbi:cytochrome p450 [Pyrenophora seminiperda CCB06]|uniref:Cytochrome P450 monooxygenase ABA1 n=1 Tax=Pyrenophora seminiperda CCB06 TaxID=1302712 RepID=A0A3M7MJ66_9PLEO|nr:cytochrome p450 [Pyrenophora seminiperda CCB06]